MTDWRMTDLQNVLFYPSLIKGLVPKLKPFLRRNSKFVLPGHGTLSLAVMLMVRRKYSTTSRMVSRTQIAHTYA